LHEEAVEAYKIALKLDPSDKNTRVNRIILLFSLCDWKGYDKEVAW
jgi:hypothetical protein